MCYLGEPDNSRYIYLYLSSAKEKAHWEKLAKQAGLPLSRFVIEIVSNALAEDEEIKPRGELSKRSQPFKKKLENKGSSPC